MHLWNFRKHLCNFFLFNHVITDNYSLCFYLFRCLLASHLWILTLLVFPCLVNCLPPIMVASNDSSYRIILFGVTHLLNFRIWRMENITFISYFLQIWGVAQWSSGLPGGAVAKNPPANAGDTWYTGLIPGLERCPRAGNGNLLQHSCLENSMDRRAWWAIVRGVTKSWTWLSD